MQNQIVVASATNLPALAAKRANEEVKKLQKRNPRWRVINVVTTTTIFGIKEDSHQMPPIHHANYTVTVTMQLDE